MLTFTSLIGCVVRMHRKVWEYPCVPRCPLGGSESARGLSIHQTLCKHSHEYDRIRATKLTWKQHEACQAEKNALWNMRVLMHSRSAPQDTPRMEVDDLPQLGHSDEPPLLHHDETTEPSIAPLPDSPVLGRGRHAKRPTWKVLEQRTLPSVRTEVTTASNPPPPEDPLLLFEESSTAINRYGLYCKYLSSIPTLSRTHFTPTPIHFVEPITRVPMCLCAAAPLPPPGTTSTSSNINRAITQCSNDLAQLIMEWHWANPVKSLADTNKLVHEVFLHNLMRPQQLAKFDVFAETKHINAALTKLNDGWQETSVEILVPDGQPHLSPAQPPVPIFAVPRLLHRSITEIIKTVWTSPDSSAFQYVPFCEFWTQSKSGVDEQVHGELYTSEVFNEAYADLQKQLPEPGCLLEDFD